MKSKTLLMETVTGKPVFTSGGKWSTEKKPGWRRADTMLAGGTQRNREYNIRKASEQVGEPCLWIKGPEVEYVSA